MTPTPAERLAAKLEHVPDACRALVAEIERVGSRGGGVMVLRLEVSRAGEVEAVELPRRYGRAGP